MGRYTQNDVANFLDIMPMSESEARQWLDRYDDVAAAIDKYLELGGILPSAQSQEQQMHWDENLFNSDRDVYGPEPRPSAPSFEIQAPDQVPQRPNSRVNNWVNDSSMTEDEQLKMALEQSKQETGIAERSASFQRVSDQFFAPSMQVAPFSAFAFNMDTTEPPPPEQRKRSEDGAPVFIRPSLEKKGHLPSLLTILNHIPLARELLLGRDTEIPDYGEDREWWNGKNFEIDASQPATTAHVFAETQRLMAALDQSGRAYLSIDALETDVKESMSQRDPHEPWEKVSSSGKQIPGIPKFLHALLEVSEANMTQERWQEFRAAFQSQLRPANIEAANEEDKTMYSLDYGAITTRPGESFFSLLSRIFTASRDVPGLPYFHHLAHVLIVEVDTQAKFGFKVPTSFNARRLLGDPPAYFTDALNGQHELELRIQGLEKEKHVLSFADNPNAPGSRIPYNQLLDAAIRHLSQTPTTAMWQKAPQPEEDLMEMEDEGDDETRKAEGLATRSKLVNQLKAKKKAIAERIQSIDDALQKAQTELNEYLVKYDVEDPDESPDTEYWLTGVSPSYDVTYVLVKTNNDDNLLVTDEEDTQWWRIEFTHGSPCSFSVKKVREIEVRKAAADTTNPVLLVYSDHYALSQERKGLSGALETFVENDNEHFQLELEDREAALQQQQQTADEEMQDIQVDPAFTQHQEHPIQPNWGGEDGPPQLPPRTAQASAPSVDGESPAPSEKSVKEVTRDGSKKRSSRFTTGIRNALSRSKSRERGKQVDLLTDDAEQAKGAAVMTPDGKLRVPGSQHEDKKAKR